MQLCQKEKKFQERGWEIYKRYFLGPVHFVRAKSQGLIYPPQRVRAVLTQPLVWGERARVCEYFSRGTTRVDIVIIIIVIYSDHLAFFVSAPRFARTDFLVSLTVKSFSYFVPDEKSTRTILKARMNYTDFSFIKTIGRGAFGEVQLVSGAAVAVLHCAVVSIMFI